MTEAQLQALREMKLIQTDGKRKCSTCLFYYEGYLGDHLPDPNCDSYEAARANNGYFPNPKTFNPKNNCIYWQHLPIIEWVDVNFAWFFLFVYLLSLALPVLICMIKKAP